MTRAVVAVAVAVAAVVAGCGGPVTAVDAGRALFADPRVSQSEFNAFSCATCHDDGSNEGQAAIFSGAPLQNSVFRSSWWGGQAPTLKDAVDNCLLFFMREPALAADDPRGRALYEYLLSISPERPSDNVNVTVVENVLTAVPRRDPRRGEEVWLQACQSCHGDPHTGAGRLNDLVTVVPEGSEDFAEQSGFGIDVVIAEKVRHGPFFGIGGNMPLFSLEALSDDDLGALLAFLLPDQ
jgi:thiosulfate dehydrogenase